MAEGEEKETIEENLVEGEELFASKTQVKKSLQLDISEEHGNWLTVGELINFIQKPIYIYIDEIVKAFHEKLCDLLSVGKCSTSIACKAKTKAKDLCKSCKSWFDQLRASHEKGNNPSWRKNCDTARWSEDRWEVAKFFMPALGDNRGTVKDAESTDLSSLLNVLEWLKDAAFLGKTRVNVDLVRKLRSQVRNTWAHAPKQELTDDERTEGFEIASNFLEDLDKVFPNPENGECLKHLEYLKANGVTNVIKSEVQYLLLQCELLYDIKNEITGMKAESSSEKRALEGKLISLECALNECSQRMSDFESLKENINEQFNTFAEKLKSFRAIPGDIHKIRDSIVQIRDDVAKIANRQSKERPPTSCLPDKSLMFTGREDEIEKVVSFLIKNEGKAIVCLHGGPGFGKTAIAVEVSHKLSEDHQIPVVFSHLSTAATIDEMILRLCLDAGVNYEDDPKSSLIFWLKNIKNKMVFVMDDIDNLLKENTRRYTYEFIKLLRKNSNQNCQIFTTSRSSYSIPDLSTANVSVGEMDDEACMKLLGTECPEHKDAKFLQKLAELCGKVPLAMCIAGSRVGDFKDSGDILEYLRKKPMKFLESPESDQYVYRAINMSYERLHDPQKEALVRLAVFEGSFSEDAAGAVIEKDNLDSKDILNNLARQSLIKQLTPHRFSIHLLIRRFLIDRLNSKDEITERAHVESLMVGYYLHLGHKLTTQSYSKDGYKDNREILKKEAQNIQHVLQICSGQEDSTSGISNSLVASKIYNTSARHFSLFVRTIIPGTIVDNFLQRCVKLAREREELALKINFDCLLAEQERSNSIGNTNENFTRVMEAIKEEFYKHYEDLKEDKSLCAHFYHQYAQRLMRLSGLNNGIKKRKLQDEPRKLLEEALKLRRTLTGTPEGEADKVFSLLKLADIWKFIAKTDNYLKNTKRCEESTKHAQIYYEEAIESSQRQLGENELTSACYKSLGDQLLLLKHNAMAETHYIKAKEMREKLGLHASEKHVFLLNQLGRCLTYSGRGDEAIQLLEIARDTAEKLAESDKPNVCKTKVYAALAFAHWAEPRNPENAKMYAEKAFQFGQIKQILKGQYDIGKLEHIASRSKTIATTI